MFTFLHQTDKFIVTGDMAAQTFWQWSDDIKPKDDITPFDGTWWYNDLNSCLCDLAEWLELLISIDKVATFLGSIPASSDNMESEGRQMK